jgi:hypothetical protein
VVIATLTDSGRIVALGMVLFVVGIVLGTWAGM